jgi:hypothetical protein
MADRASDRPPHVHGVCRLCHLGFEQHAKARRSGHTRRVCADGRLYRGHIARHGASNSFGLDEIALMNQMLAALTRGGDLSSYVRHPAFPRVAAKWRAMQQSAERRAKETSRG